MSNSASRIPYVIGGILAAMVIIFGMIIFGLPKLKAAGEFNAATALQEQRNTQLDGEAAKVHHILDTWDKTVGSAGKFSSAFPQDPEQQGLYKGVIEAAKDAGVELVLVETGQPADAETQTDEIGAELDQKVGSGELTEAEANAERERAAQNGQLSTTLLVTISAEGDRSGLEDMVANLEEMERPVSVDSLSLTSSDKESALTVTGRVVMVSPLTAPRQEAPEAKTADKDA